MDLAKAQQIEHACINGRNVWINLIQSTIGDYFFTQYEEKGMEITDSYVGPSQAQAEKAFNRAVKKILAGK